MTTADVECSTKLVKYYQLIRTQERKKEEQTKLEKIDELKLTKCQTLSLFGKPLFSNSIRGNVAVLNLLLCDVHFIISCISTDKR